MISQRPPKQTATQERRAYNIATERDSTDGTPTCQRCRRDCGGVQRDHRQNRQNNTVPSNLQLLGAGCHLWKNNNPDVAVFQGWAVPRFIGGLTPADIPARRWRPSAHGLVRLGWVLLDDVGGVTEITDTQADYIRRKVGIV